MNPIFTTVRWVRWSTAGLVVLFSLVAVLVWWRQGWSLLSLAPTGLAVVSLAVWIQTLMARVELASHHLVFTRRYRCRRLPAAAIDRVELRDGVPPAVRLDDQRLVYLPEVGQNNGVLVEAIECWLEKTRRTAIKEPDTKKPG